MRTSIIRIIFGVIGLFLIGSAYLLWSWNHPLRPGSETYEVKPGTSLRAFARMLSARHVLPESHSFVLLAHLTGHDRALKSGEYRFRDGMSARELLDQIIAGRVIEYSVVLVEGWTFGQFLAALTAAPKLGRTLTGKSHEAVMERLGHSDEHPEGRFFPDTYYYSAGQTDIMILANAYDKMQQLLQRAWEGRENNLPLNNPYEALILASIVEKETGQANERGLIAGVFINRLRLGMRLQSDPTVIYGMGKEFDGNIRLKDLRNDTPYNTYTRKGLPPTPVAMPGKEALQAVLHPAATKALYFVSRGDGSHEFSSSLEEHNRAVLKYQLKGKSRNVFPSRAPDAVGHTSKIKLSP
ncbi:MAG: endolytic transglycosylase MltG [Gammaproteobacteria bacterium]|nr:endolytic transglycosylase MltG [Gammaproteobacteria bacterium]MDH3406568.1 endolytic transglycosylase MltG [Gammaproteobacteria bacterium]MDH3562426.1 endolytic transglycosylase MltG [Gammaproteobacteria bacterium]MDH5486279.1 endolytic transglycosylase MltG [Gammaproteobacteria bacterium]